MGASREMRGGALFLLAAVCATGLVGAGARRVRAKDIRASYGQSFGGQHPDAHVHGFTLRAVYTHKVSPDGAQHHLQKRILKFDRNPHLLSLETLNARRRLLSIPLPDLSASVSSAEKVISLSKLSLLAYPGAKNPSFSDYYYSQATLDPIYAAGDGIFESSNTRDGELQAMQDLWNTVNAELNASVVLDNATATAAYYPDGVGGAESDIGVAALEFKRGNTVVMVFRGTVTAGDFSHIELWLFDWVLERMTAQMKKMWVEDAGLVWGDVQKERESEDTTIATTAIRAQTWFLPSGFGSNLAAASNKIDGLTVSEDEASKYGYWPITKMIADDLHAAVTASGEELIFSGHSQGGTRASLVSMYLRKKYSVSYDATVFSSTGPQCFPRLLGSDTNLLDDVNPYISHPQVTDYSHVLDPWGHGLGLEVGRQCLYGKTDIQNTKAYKYCSKIWGHPAPNLIYANSAPEAIKTSADKQLDIDFAQCRLMTHLVETVVQDIMKPGVLLPNGDTADGCTLVDVAPESDPNKVCPEGNPAWLFWATVGGILVIVAIVVCCLISVVVCVCCRRRAKSKSNG
mmetsp:Transcript_59071/g.144909  ORF Transcript_59071/g.144909 Transcript_59071/m.144909 type:complete len:573 (+) Transcript_59071:106-1824(+)